MINSNTSLPYSNNLFYDPVPFEWLRTAETQPQLEVTVGGEPAVCHNLTCGYAYEAPVGEVTAFTYNTATRQLTLTGTDLPASTSLIRRVMFAKSPCVIDAASVSATGLTCTLKYEPTCGNHLPQLTAIAGHITNNAALVA